MGNNTLTNDEIYRYSRHLLMPEVGVTGQKRLKKASVLIIGTGGLGSPVALYLAAAGVGKIGLVDFDIVDESNLQRQIIHSTSSVGYPKLISAKKRLSELNPFIEIELYDTVLTSANALEIIKDYDVVIDGTDNFPTRYLLNDTCVILNKPLIYGSIFRFEGQLSVFYSSEGPCYRCLFQEPPPHGLVPSCAEGGVFGVLPGVIGTLQATEAIKFIIQQGNLLIGRLLLYDALNLRFREINIRKDPNCPICGDNPTIRQLIDYEAFCNIPTTEELKTEFDIYPEELKNILESKDSQIVLLDVREKHEWEICRLEGAILIPLAELPENLNKFDPTKTYIIYCKIGKRSIEAAYLLQSAGLRVRNLVGGINAWSRKVDCRVPLY
ncbi:MAG: molybdopterin-synthase adenylyltransferase MoeB [Thermodesulfovibrionales bacterium]|nr:molybdopterin-synthase adenylyltransferase MoeB [Thermodesulfovibrionales bacterium]